MQCLILAAGQGTRLRSLAASKPLAEIDGKPLIAHVVRAAKAGGATSFLIVTGYRAEAIEAMLPALSEEAGVPIEAVRNPDWARPNGLSVLAAAPKLEDEFLLLMSDHLFDPGIAAGLIAGRRRDAALTLAADFDPANPLIDIDDATKLRVDGEGRIGLIGKTLADYNAIDTGIFHATPALIDALRRSLAEGGAGSLSEGVQRLAEDGRAFVHDIAGGWWIDVDDEAAFRRAEETLPEGLLRA
ncbi:MAG: 1L-myo-inositol 1-phosphate cytidylyltransferase [Sphingomonadales bacterium]|jgi:choline kinase|nr:1L-myo-inositol 1-phosphate cytidylyltransferase [Sphingomonadales bacterium]